MTHEEMLELRIRQILEREEAEKMTMEEIRALAQKELNEVAESGGQTKALFE